MRKSKLIFGALSLLLAGAMIFTGCNQDPEPEPEVVTYTVTFDCDGGTGIEAVTVEENATVTKPTDPTREGYTFVTWNNGEVEYNFDDPVTSDLTLKAIWKVITCTVTFNTNGGSAIDPVTLNYGEKVTLPADPTKDGSYFAGWFTNEDCTEAYTDAVIKADTTLYAKWSVEKPYVITLNYNYEGSTDTTVNATSENGYRIIETPTASREGFELAGWYSDAACTTEVDFSAAFTGDTTIYAGWKTKSLTVNFELDGTTLSTQTINYGEKVSCPKIDDSKIPEGKTGYWKFVKADGSAFDFSSLVSADTTIKVVFAEIDDGHYINSNAWTTKYQETKIAFDSAVKMSDYRAFAFKAKCYDINHKEVTAAGCYKIVKDLAGKMDDNPETTPDGNVVILKYSLNNKNQESCEDKDVTVAGFAVMNLSEDVAFIEVYDIEWKEKEAATENTPGVINLKTNYWLGTTPTENDDGSVSLTVKCQYSGGGVVFYINSDKSDFDITDYTTLDVDFSYVVNQWTDGAAIKPQFVASLVGPEATELWKLDSKGDKYFSGNGLDGGEVKQSLALSDFNATSNTIRGIMIKLNAYEKTATVADDDNITMTIKSIKLSK